LLKRKFRFAHALVIAIESPSVHDRARQPEMADMDREGTRRFGLGTSILGGAAGGLSYEGALRDAVAREAAAQRREAGRLRRVSAPQTQPLHERQPESVQA
jgi:hypothetical protein